MQPDLPRETRCGSCSNWVRLRPRKWYISEDGAFNATKCPRCGCQVVAAMGAPHFLDFVREYFGSIGGDPLSVEQTPLAIKAPPSTH